MGEGNAIAHLMPQPMYAYRMVVAAKRAPEESIQDQIDKIVDASATQRYKIEVMPSVYPEAITMKQYVDVVAPYGRAVIRPPAGTTTAVTMADDCMLQGMMIDMQSMDSPGTGVAFGDVNRAYMEDCWVTGGGATDTGVSDASAGTTVLIRRCRIDGAATGYKKTGGGTTWFYDNRVTGSLSLRSVQGAAAYDDGVGYTDETTEANDDTANDMNLFPAASLCNPAVNDAYYFGGAWPFQQLSLNVGTAGVGTWTIVWEYYDRETADWATLTVTDNTNGFHNSGTKTVTFTPPATWAPTDNGALLPVSCYWIRARISVMPGPITTRPLGTQAWVTDAIDIDVDAGTLNLIENELMYEGTGGNVDLASGTINSFGNTLAGDGWRIADDADAKVYSHNDNFTKVMHAGDGFMIAKEEPQTYLVHNGMKIGDAITDIAATGQASDTNRYMIRVFSGEYSESVTMAQYVDLIGESSESVVISQAATNVIAANSDSRIRNVRVELTAGTGQAGIYINDVAAVLEDVKVIVTRVSGTNYGIQTAGTGGVTAYGLDIYANNASDYPGNFAGSGTHVIYDSYFENGAGYDINVVSSTVNSFNNKLMGGGWQIANDASAIVRSHTDYFTTVSKGADGVMTCQEKPNVWRVFNGMEIADAHTAASAGDLIEVGPGSYAEALTISKAVTIVSLDGCERTTITQPDADVITLSAAATIDGFTVNVSAASGARTCIAAADQAAYIKNCTFTQSDSAGYGVTVSTGSALITGCTFSSGLDIAISQTGNGDAKVAYCRILNGATAGVQIADGALTISHSRINVAGNGLSSITNDGIIWADHCDITGTAIDCNVAASCGIYVDGCTYNDVSNLGTFVDLTGCREYTCDAGLLVGEWVYASGADAADEAKADALATMPTIGVVVYKPTDTTCKVKNYGYLYDSTAPWTAGDEYWVSAATEGEITNVMPAVWPQRAGVAVATDRFKILIGDNLGLVHCNEYAALAAQTVGEWVYITTTDDTVAEADASDAAKMPAIGVIVDKPTATRALVKLRGKYAEASKGWTASDDVYMDPTTPGAITNVVPGIGVIQKVAEVKKDDGTTIIYEIAD